MNISVPARANEALIDQLHHCWQADRHSVSPDWAAFFEGFELGLGRAEAQEQRESGGAAASPIQSRVDDLVDAYRTLGHTASRLDPLSPNAPVNSQLELSQFGLGPADLDEIVSSRYFRKGAAMPLRQMLDELRRTYCDTLGAEFEHIQDPVIREWVVERLENRPSADRNDPALHRRVLETLYEAETFESFIHAKYVGQKRFSLEGGESLMVALKTILDSRSHR
ncbi:MAG: 2-oxoglutarate dehydrogenase E1 subunit family protein [Verrucomicrobiota bacterium]